MISGIRNSMGNKGVKYFLWGALLAIPGGSLLVSLADRASSKSAQSVATVNGDPISNKELRLKAYQYQETLKRMAQFFPVDMLGDPVDLALNDLIQEKLLLGAANQLGFKHLSTDYVNDTLEDPASGVLPKELYDDLGELNHNMLQVFLRRQGITITEFEDQIENSLKRQQVLSVIKSAQYIPQAVFKSLQLRENSTRVFTFLSLDLNDYIKQSRLEKDSDTVIKEYFQQKNNLAKSYWVPEKRWGTVWEFTAETYGLPVSEKDIKVFYARNKEKFGDKKLEAVRSEIVASIKREKFKARFSTDSRRIIANLSNDPKALEVFAKKHNGKRTMLNEELKSNSGEQKKLFDLSRVGKAGVVVSGHKGSVVVLDKIEESYEPKFADVREQVEQDFHAERARDRLKADMINIKKELKSDSNAAELAKKWNSTLKTYTVESADAKLWEQLSKEELPVSRMKNMIHDGYALEHLVPTGGYLVLLSKITASEPTKESEKDAKETAKQALIKQNESLFTSAFIASLQNNATIIYNEIQKTPSK